MRVLIASLDEKELVGAKDYGVYGIITNPTIVAANKEPWKKSVERAAKIIDGPFHLQITEDYRDGILRQAEEFAEVLGERLVVKVCLTQESLAAMQTLKQRGYKVNLTGIVSIPQTFVAVQSGADFVSIYAGRADDIGADGIDVIQTTVDYIRQFGYKTNVVAASIRGVAHYVDSAKAGAHWIACPYPILAQSIKHPVTDKGIVNFKRDWEKIAHIG